MAQPVAQLKRLSAIDPYNWRDATLGSFENIHQVEFGNRLTSLK